MTWFDKIQDLQYYHQPKGLPCYCDTVAYPGDMFLQGQVYGNGSYTLKIYVYSADGLTQYEDATAYFDYYFAVMPTTKTHFFNARLRSFSPAMCAHECYILHVVAEQGGGMAVFSKYTERYCQSNCCDVPRNITIGQSGMVQPPAAGDLTIIQPAGDVPVAGATSATMYIPVGSCGEQLVRIVSRFDCIDKFTGDFYDFPEQVLSGDATFSYRKVTTLRGRIVRRPRDIKRETSYNCRVLRSESAAQYLLEGFEYLPPWKMYEIEGQLHANHIYVDDFSGTGEYRFDGGVAFKQVSKCFELFKLEVVLQDCEQRQVFGCGESCGDETNFDGSDILFAIPAGYNGGAFFNSNGVQVANDYNGLLDYLRTRDGVSNVSDVEMEDMECTAYKVVSVSSTGATDTYIYYDAPVQANKIYGVQAADINDICATLPATCTRPIPGVWMVAEPVCAIPVQGIFAVADTDTDVVSITGYHSWVADAVATEGAIYNREVTFSIKVTNDTITADPDNPADDVLIAQVIGIVGSNGRPATEVTLNHSNSTVPGGATITIDAAGRIVYYGPVTTATVDDVTIELTNIKYNT